jgi:hypothetical protein
MNGGEEDESPQSEEREREEAVQLPHKAAAETAGARRNRAATSMVTRSRQRARGD